MHSVRTPSQGDVTRHASMSFAGNSSFIDSSASRTNALATDERASSSAAAVSAPSHAATERNPLRARRSHLPDIGTPIKVESSSPYRTPESTSKASLLLARTPFGTPAKANTQINTATSANTSTSASTSSNAKPVALVTGFWPESWALAKSLVDPSAYATFALQPRPHLPYSGYAATALRVNWARLALFVLVSHHALFVISLFRPTNPLQLLTLLVRPFALFLSLASYAVIVCALLLIPGQLFSLSQKSWSDDKQSSLKDELLLGFTCPAGSTMSFVARTLHGKAFWRGVLLNAVITLALGGSNAAALMHYAHHSSTTADVRESWAPYVSVPIRLAQGYKTVALRPNERFWFLLCSNTALGIVYTFLRTLSSMRATQGAAAPFSAPRFDAQASFESSWSRISSKVQKSMRNTVLFGTLAPLLFLQLYLFFRRPFFRVILSFIGHQSALRPLIIPSLKRSLLSFDLVFRSSTLGLCTAVLLELINSSWDVFATQPVGIRTGGLSKYSREPTNCLIRGMQLRRTAMPEEAHLGMIERSYFAHFAFAEMATVVATDAERRKAIFRSVGNAPLSSAGMSLTADANGQSAWSRIAQECIRVLQDERKCVENKGREAAQSALPLQHAQAQQSKLKPVDAAHKLALESGSGVKTHTPSIWDRLSSSTVNNKAGSMPATSATQASSAAPFTQNTSSPQEGLNSILHKIAEPSATSAPPSASALSSAAAPAPATQPSAGAGKQPVTLMQLLAALLVNLGQALLSLVRLLPSDLQHVIRNSFFVRKLVGAQQHYLAPSNEALLLAGIVPHDEALATWSVQTLGALLSASLEQDEYGTVTLASNAGLGVDDVLDEMSLLLFALQKWGQDCSSSSSGAEGTNADAVTAHFDEYVAPLILALRTSITLTLSAFKSTDYRIRGATQSRVDTALNFAAIQ